MCNDKIGIEREYWLVDKKSGKIVEPAIYGFPFDEFGFLIEVRSSPYTNIDDLLFDFNTKFEELSKKAEKLGLELQSVHKKRMPKKFLKVVAKKYKHGSLPDLTLNIYANHIGSHATGLGAGFGTAGLHIHFSRYIDGKRVQLPIYEMVKDMDERFKDIINLSERNLGEFEGKVHGFEYRSLPSDITLSVPIEFAFSLFKKYPYTKKEVS